MAELPDNGLNRRITEADAVAKECEEVDADIAALRAAYEQYFLGAEKMPPSDKHTALTRRMKKLKGMFVRHTALKFRINNLQGKLATYERLWTRTIQQIEAGTYKRDLFKAKLRAQKAAKAEKKDNSKDVVELDGNDLLEELPLDAVTMAPPEPAPVAQAAPAVKTNPAGVPVVPAAATKSSTGIPAVAPLGQSQSGIPAVPRTNPAGVPVAPAVKSSPTGVPAVAPVGQSQSGIPAVPRTNPAGVPVVPAARTVSTPGMPAVPRSNPAGTPAAAPRANSVPGMPAVARPASSSGAPRVSPPAASGGGDISEAKLKAVYDAYVTAKKRCQEDTSKISYEQVAANLRKQVPELMKKHNAAGVEFKVVIKDGKAVLKAVPK